jgi:putative (di)nucleoside polyphosphate hydrolase
MGSQHFRAGVVVVVRHPDRRQVLAFQRRDAPGSWQLPQGGLDTGEDPVDAAWRELGEETGLGDAHVSAVAEYPDWVAYEWPAEVRRLKGHEGSRRGQVQRWFLFDARSGDIEPVPDGREFDAWKWVDPDDLVAEVVSFRRASYGRVLDTLVRS